MKLENRLEKLETCIKPIKNTKKEYDLSKATIEELKWISNLYKKYECTGKDSQGLFMKASIEENKEFERILDKCRIEGDKKCS